MVETRAKRSWRARDIIVSVLIVIVIGGLATARTLYTPYRIPSRSMTPTLIEGEYVIAANGRPQLHVGDIVFHTEIAPHDLRPDGRTYVRRVLALPGQRIAFRDGVPIVDGVAAQQVATGETGPDGERIVRETLAGHSYRVAYRNDGMPDLRNMSERIVPPGRVFLAGDARDNSLDSRINGPQPISGIKQSGGWIIFSPVSGRAGHRIE
jgi:signal peptidase I